MAGFEREDEGVRVTGPLISRKVAAASNVGGDGMAAAFHAIMGRTVEKRLREGSDDGPAQIKGVRRLASVKAAERTGSARAAEGRASRKRRRELGHLPPVAATGPHERQLVRVATKGVVRLFNAVATAQELREAAEARGDKRRDVARLSRSSFLSELKKQAAGGSDELANEKDNEQNVDKGGATSWRVLEEDSLGVKALKLKDWDRVGGAEGELAMQLDSSFEVEVESEEN